MAISRWVLTFLATLFYVLAILVCASFIDRDVNWAIGFVATGLLCESVSRLPYYWVR